MDAHQHSVVRYPVQAEYDRQATRKAPSKVACTHLAEAGKGSPLKYAIFAVQKTNERLTNP